MWYVDKYRVSLIWYVCMLSQVQRNDAPCMAIMQNVTMATITTIYGSYYGIVEFSVSDKQWLLLFCDK